ncbi:MAG: vWA domain-containing protein [Nannocystaceae bacterium]
MAMRTSRWAVMIGAAGLVTACGGEDGRGDTAGGPGIGSLSQGQDTDAQTGGQDTEETNGATMGVTMGATGEADSSGGALKFDLGEQPDANVVVEEGCTKVDFLFVIDNSGSMNDEQANLVNSFPGFITGIQSSLEQVDEYQVGVVTTDQYSYNIAGCNGLSSLVVQTGGGFSSNANCGPYAAGNNFMTEADDLNATFACAAQVGTSGSGQERPMQAMVETVQKVEGGPGQCNEGFLRDDALLVIVIITDEWDGPNDPEIPGSTGTPQTWYDAVIAAKLGIPENAVALALINYVGSPTCAPASPPFDGVHIRDFVNLFGDNGFLGGVCEPDYGPVFADAVAIVEDACNNFQPPG